MIHLVCDANLHRYAAQLDQMFALRSPPVDREDDEAAVYLMSIMPRGGLVSAVRLRPVGDSGRWWRLARWVRGPEADSQTSTARLLLAAVEFALLCGLQGLVLGDAPESIQRLLAGWPPVGEHGDELHVEASLALLQHLREQAGMPGEALTGLSAIDQIGFG